MSFLREFVDESLKIEGITRSALLPEMEAMEAFLKLPKLDVSDVSVLARAFTSQALLRNRRGMNVRVGNHKPPVGGPGVVRSLEAILAKVNADQPMWPLHIDYESLHPYMDGNGRSGRAIWLWQWVRKAQPIPRSFLHMAYYQALAAGRP